MKRNAIKVIALLLSLAMLLSVMPLSALAVADKPVNPVGFGTNDYYNVISRKEYTLVPGAATEIEMVINNNAGNRRNVMHIIELDPSNPDISIIPGYYGIDTDLSDVNNWKVAGVTDTVAYYENVLGYNVIGAMNTSLAYDSNAPIDFLVYNGVNLSQGSHHAQTFLAVIKDPDTGEISCELHNYADGIPENCWQAVSANFGFTVRDGVLVNATEERTSSTAARSMIGIKEDGTLVLVMNDGRNANNSVGFNTYELGESMLALGCKWAVNCDGGGSSSFVTKRAGETVNTMRCVPCDGAERPTINSILITSNVAPTGVLNNVNIESGYDYFAPGTTYTFGAEAIDTHGYGMDMPADAVWALSDPSFGTISNGTFVSNGTLGDVEIQVLSGGEVVGALPITVANPTTLYLSSTETTLPYSKPDAPRSITLPIVARIGEANVYTDGSTYQTTLNPANGGTINGLVFTATEDNTIPSVVITLTYLPTNEELTYTVTYGKGSEILWDYEDGEKSGFVGFAEARQYFNDHNVPVEDQFKLLISGGQIAINCGSETFIASRENGGQVHNGDYALGVHYDFLNTDFNSWVYAILYKISERTVLKDTVNGENPTGIGAWVYVPKGFSNPDGDTAGSLSMQFTAYLGNRDEETGVVTMAGTTELNMQYKGKNLNALKEADIPENRWVYVRATFPTAYNYIATCDPTQPTQGRCPSFIRMYIKPTRAQMLTYYFDDFTLDYSDAVDDREPPVITNPTYCTNDENIAFSDTVVTVNTMSFSANIADYDKSNATGLDYNTAAIYADGVKLSGVTASGSAMNVDNVVLSNGAHKIKFEIADQLGNYTTLTKDITVNAEGGKSGVTIVGHNDLGNVPEYDSVYYIDVKADAAEDIQSIETTLFLNTANKWELEHISAPAGVSVSYEANEVEPNHVTFTITKSADCALTGEQILASIPVRVWSYDESTIQDLDDSTLTKAEKFASNYCPKVNVTANVEMGKIVYTDAAEGTFNGTVDVVTKINITVNPWHDHNAVPVEDLAPSCTAAGFTGRTYCEECGSVVDWGTDIPAAGHDYEISQLKRYFIISDNGASQSADLEFNGGIGYYYDNGYHAFETDATTNTVTFTNSGNFSNPTLYYWVEGQDAPVEWPGTAMTYLGQNEYGQAQYTFEMPAAQNALRCSECGDVYPIGTGIFTAGGKTYYAIGGNLLTGWQDTEDGWYYFSTANYAGLNGSVSLGGIPFEFENGKLLHGTWVEDENGTKYYYGPDYYRCAAGNTYANVAWAEIDGNTYGFDRQGYRHEGIRLIKASNDPTKLMEFTMDGVLIGDYVTDYTGIYYCNGQHTYLENGVPQPAGMVLEDGYYYYIDSGCFGVYGTYNCTRCNDLMPNGTYDFDELGRLFFKNGPWEDGYFYLNGVRQKCYQLIEYEGDWYFINDGHKYAKNTRLYLSAQFVEGTGFTVGYYDFAADGKMIIRNGPQEDGYFYINGARLSCYQLVEYEGDYYFIDDGHKYAKNKRVYLSAQFVEGTDFPVGYYEFGEDGKLVMKNGPQADGYFYRNGVRLSCYQLVEYEGDWYFINDSHKIAKDKRIYLSAQFVEGTDFTVGYYDFDADGKMIIKNGPQEDGYFYRNGARLSCYQLVEYEGDWYFINDGHKIAKNKRLYMSAQFVENTPFAVGYYDFDADGKLVVLNGPQEDGYFYLDGVRLSCYQLVKYNGAYYFIDDGHKYARNKRIYLSAQFIGDEPLEVGYYQFGADGTLQDLVYYYNDEGEIETDLGLILKDGYYYYVRTTGQLAIGRFKIDKDKTNDFLKGDQYFNFDEQGRMIPPAFYIVGIRNGRDPGLMDRIKTTDGKDVKSGLLLRGGEFDGALHTTPLPEYVKEYDIDLLKNTYHVKSEIDLRNPDEVAASEVGLTDPLGEGVMHNYYNCPLYNNIFTEDGKAKIKAIFDDLCNPENYPVYVHCTYGLDRTGVVCFLVEGAIGVGQQDCIVEYCTTKGSDQPAIDNVVNYLKANYAGSTFNERVRNYLLDCGVTAEQLAALYEILVED